VCLALARWFFLAPQALTLAGSYSAPSRGLFYRGLAVGRANCCRCGLHDRGLEPPGGSPTRGRLRRPVDAEPDLVRPVSQGSPLALPRVPPTGIGATRVRHVAGSYRRVVIGPTRRCAPSPLEIQRRTK
jgi:hypothetical protein